VATPNKPVVPVLVHTEKASAIAVSTTGIKLSYVVPAGRVSKLLDASWFLVAGAAPTIALQVILGGVTITINSFTVGSQPSFSCWLASGDTVQWNVTTLGAAGTADLTLALEDYEAQ
jgi:hypothetical protein